VSRRAIGLAAAAVVVFFSVTLVTLTHVITGSGTGCTIEAPAPSLPASLRSLGGFDQSYDANNPDELAQVGSNAAAAVSPDLDGANPIDPVRVKAVAAGQPDAVVIPLAAQEPTGAGTRIVGLVSFYVGCGARAYFGSVVDISTLGSVAPVSFPSVTKAAAAAELGTSTPALSYTTSPFMPEWRDTQTGATVAAGE
jgi:hypothetical protein